MRHVTAAALMLLAPTCGYAQDGQRLIQKLEKLAESNNAEAIYHLGMAYQTGSGVPIDHKTALKYFERATTLGDPLAAYKLGCFWDGQNDVLERDPVKALHYKLIAARAGYALAQQDVARLYVDQRDFAFARTWLSAAAAQGTSGAIMAYASLHNGAEGFAPDKAVTAAYFAILLARKVGSDEQRKWLEDFTAELSPEERRRSAAIVADYRPRPTALTIKALSGQEAAQALVETEK